MFNVIMALALGLLAWWADGGNSSLGLAVYFGMMITLNLVDIKYLLREMNRK